MLRLEGQTVGLPILAIAGSIQLAVQRIAGIELDARLVGKDGERAVG